MYASWHSAYCQPPEAAYGRKLSDRYPTVAELMKRGGYATIGVAANLYLRADFGMERGFDEFRIPRPVPLLPDDARWLLRHNVRRWVSYTGDTAQFDRLYALGEDIDSELFAVMEQRTNRQTPFFVFLNYMDAHFPYVPPAPFNERFPGRRPGRRATISVNSSTPSAPARKLPGMLSTPSRNTMAESPTKTRRSVA
jgi:arylsulfatase A-like enzyme